MNITKADIKGYRELAIKQMIDDIKYMDNNGVPPEEMWDNMNVKENYSYYATEEDKIKAFEACGFTIEFE